jgi:chromosome segregation ATPase
MFGGVFAKIALAQLLIILCMIGGGYAYYNHVQGVITILQDNAAKLQTAVETQQATIQAQQEAAARQGTAITTLQRQTVDAESRRRELESVLRQRDLATMGRTNSADLERRMNRATDRVFRDLEHLTAPKDRPTPRPSVPTQ